MADPEPPEVLVPKPATDLEARQVDERILLAVSLPVENTNGSPAALGEVEVFRLTGDRRDAGPVPPAVLLAQAERIDSVPFEDLDRYEKEGKLVFRDQGASNPVDFYSHGFRYAVRFINRHNQTAGFSNQVFLAPVAIPAAPEGLAATVRSDSIDLHWKAPVKNSDGSTPPHIAGYNLYRSEDPKAFPVAPLNSAPLSQAEFLDRAFEFGKTYYYVVAVVGSLKNPYAESLPSAPLEVRPEDVFPPGAPGDLSYAVQNGIVTLLWRAPEESDVAGYRVYRREEGTSERVLLQTQLVAGLSFRDDKAAVGKTYEYSVAAVDTRGNAGPAATVLVEVR